MESIVIRPAEISDIEGILRLQSANQASQGGSLSGQMEKEQIQEMMSDMPQIVAVIDNEIAGFLLATSKTIQKRQNVPIVNATLLSYSGTPDAYIYGPICVSEDQRGKGLAQLMFKELLEQEPNREGILFIRNDNDSSLRAHEKMGMQKVSSFNFNNTDFEVYNYLFE